MHRHRLPIAVGAIITLVVIVPLLSTSVLAANPVVVEAGDTLSAISLRTGVSVRELVVLNGISDPDRILIGQRLRIEANAAAAPAAAAAAVHVVARGDSLWTIAQRYGVSVTDIVNANAIADPSRIFGGQKLTIPGAAATGGRSTPHPDAAPAAAAAAVHVVARGDSLWTIAQRYGVSVTDIVNANAIADPSRIFGGQKLTIPGAAVSTPRARASLPGEMADVMAARDSVRQLIVSEAKRAGVPVALALAVAWQESGWRQGVTSGAGAIGVMQLLPSTADWVEETMLGEAVDVRDTHDNVRAGVRLLAFYLDRYAGSRDRALAAYYQGMTSLEQHGIYPVSRTYIASVVALERLFGG